MLRPLIASDEIHLLGFDKYNSFLWKFSMISGAGEKGMHRYIQMGWKAKETIKEYPFIVIDKRSGEYADSTRFYDIQNDNKALQLSYTWYGTIFQKIGLNRHCKYLFFSIAFEEMGMERIELRADVRNLLSIAAMKKTGCIEEGIIRSHAITHQGERRYSMVLSILLREWEGGVNEKLKALMYETASPSAICWHNRIPKHLWKYASGQTILFTLNTDCISAQGR